MKSEARGSLTAAILYIVLAVMTVSVVSVAVISVANRAKKKLPEAPSDAPSAQTEPTEKVTEPSTAPSAEPSESAPVESAEPSERTDAEVRDVMPTVYVVPTHGYVSKGYEDELPVWSATMEDYRIHDGIDVACEEQSEVYSCADGTVESVSEDPLMGYTVTVYHGGGLRSVCMNLSDSYPENIKAGAPVAAGQVIGYVGQSAMVECAEVPHLHFTMTMDNKPIDPLDFVVYEGAMPSSAEWED